MLRELVDDFERDSDYCIENQVHISDEMIECFIHALDLDDSGTLEEDEVCGILSNKKTIGGQKQKSKWAWRKSPNSSLNMKLFFPSN